MLHTITGLANMVACYLNGSYLPLDRAKISVMDRGFLFSEAVYEVIPIYNNTPFLEKEHIERLQKSLDALRIYTDFPSKASDIIHQLIEKEPLGTAHIYIHISRGASTIRNHQLKHAIEPTILVAIFPTTKKKHAPCSIITHEEIRWRNCWIKSTSLLGNILGIQAAQDQDAQECIFHDNKSITEGSSSNVFIIQNNHIKTPPLSKQILGGITRETVIQLCHHLQIPFQESPISLTELMTAEASFITSSTRGISPVACINQQQRNTDHAFINDLKTSYDEHINQIIMSH